MCKECNKNALNELLQILETRELTPIQILQEIQNKFGYLPKDAVELCSKKSGKPLSEFYSIMTFYSQFKMHAQAKFEIEICTGTACYVKGADKILDLLKQRLKTEEHVPTADSKFCYHTSRCFGCCSLAPVVKVNGKIYPDMTTTKMEKLLQECDKDEF